MHLDLQEETPTPTVPPPTTTTTSMNSTLFQYFCGEVLRNVQWRIREEGLQTVVMNDYDESTGKVKVSPSFLGYDMHVSSYPVSVRFF